MDSAYLPLIGTISGVALGALLAWLATRHHRNELVKAEAEHLATILLGELYRISRHFAFSEIELAQNLPNSRMRTNLKLAIYGPIKTLDSGLLRFGALKSTNLERIMELNFLIRNFGIIAEELAGAPYQYNTFGDNTIEILKGLVFRAREIKEMSDQITYDIEKSFPKIALSLGKR